MPQNLNEQRPFTAAVNALRDLGYRFQDLATGSHDARSTAWFNHLVNAADPWVVSPPPKDTWVGLARLFKTSETSVREMIAREWFDASPADAVPQRVRPLAFVLDRLSAEDLALVRSVALRLIPPMDDDVFDFGFEDAETSPLDS
ncbi:hypothetical protein [Georgenia yuyongxinii]|uniref:Uncharacterized protein n=1 Tax=Georgenia yuyongxinii TaxID=2589797 RepID=A0A552WS32_9MICO|nr:hypothetical protein [Georgenia yuyongxinii]TRW45592.1 hypothetical protein FJ693_08645 [Georgenia yuyongxinii]